MAAAVSWGGCPGIPGVMTRFGYTLMTEQSGPKELVRYAVSAERAGFDFEVSSDHYFPWLASQGHARLRLVGAWRSRPGHRTSRAVHLRHLPDHALPPRGRRAEGRHAADPRRRAVHPRGGQRREPQRTRGRWALADGVAAPADAQRGHPDHSRAVHRGADRLEGRVLRGGRRADMGRPRDSRRNR